MKIDSPTFVSETTFISASVVYSSGSQKFGNTDDDIHTFVGNITGSARTTGSFGHVLADEIVRDANNHWKANWLYVGQGINYNSYAQLDLANQKLTLNKWVNHTSAGAPLSIVPGGTNEFHVTASNVVIGGDTAISGSATSTGSFGTLELGGYDGSIRWTDGNWRIKGDTSDSRLYFYDSGEDAGVYLRQGDTAWGAVSDERLKTNWVYIDNAIDKVNTLTKVGTFQRKGVDGEVKGDRFVGLSAQEVQNILPEAVEEYTSGKLDGYLSLKYDNLIPILIKSIQELSAENREIKKEFNKLKKMIIKKE